MKTTQRPSIANWLILAALVCLLVLEMGIGRHFLGQQSLLQTESAQVSRVSGVRFAIADFDGDWKPDLAFVEIAGLQRVHANYAIRLQLSAGPALSFLIDAPSGGVRVATRDVNGDNLPDVVVSSIPDQRVVAVLLNHGHGQFSPAEPSSFLDAAEPSIFLTGADQLSDKFTVASLRYSFNGDSVSSSAKTVALSADSVVVPKAPLLSVCELQGYRGRSPPRADFLS
jgi:hypothetical protein